MQHTKYSPAHVESTEYKTQYSIQHTTHSMQLNRTQHTTAVSIRDTAHNTVLCVIQQLLCAVSHIARCAAHQPTAIHDKRRSTSRWPESLVQVWGRAAETTRWSGSVGPQGGANQPTLMMPLCLCLCISVYLKELKISRFVPQLMLSASASASASVSHIFLASVIAINLAWSGAENNSIFTTLSQPLCLHHSYLRHFV